MKIKTISVRNFKSFNKLDLQLGDFNVFIGANASGKSNFIHILEFLRDISSSGLDNAVSMQGDIEFLRNINIGAEDETFINIVIDPGSSRIIHEGKLNAISAHETSYTLSLKHFKKAKGFKITKDHSSVDSDYVKLEIIDGVISDREFIGRGINSIENLKGRVKYSHELKDGSLEGFPDLPFEREAKNFPKLNKKEALLESPFFGFPFFFMGRFIEDISIYDFDPKVQKKASPISGKTDLEEDGSNVALVLKNIIEDEESRSKFVNLIQDLLPFVDGVGIEKFAGRSLIVRLKESHLREYLPASLLSDGTVKLVSLLIVLYFENKPLIVFEEPGSNLHPNLATVHLIRNRGRVPREAVRHWLLAA